MKYWLSHITRMSIPMALVLLVCASGMWVIDYIRMPELWGTILGSQLLTLVSGLLLCMTLYRAKISDNFSLLPAVLYVSAVGIFPYLREHWEPQLIAVILLLFLYATRDMTNSHEPNSLVMLMTILLCVTALWVPDAMWCILMLWLVVLLQGTFSLRTIMASLLGIILVGIYYAILLYYDIAEKWDYATLVDREWFGQSLPACITGTVGIMYAGFLGLASGAFIRSSYDLVSARMLLYHAVLTGLLSSPLIAFTATNQGIWVLMPLSLSATAGIYMLQRESESRGVSLIMYLTGAAALYLWIVLTL